MFSFKEFLLEAKKKPKEPDWPDAGREFSSLRDMQGYLREKEHRIQLFVPKRRDPKIAIEREREARYRAAKKEHPDVVKEGREERPPVLTSFRESPVKGDNKPTGAFWTSSATKKGNDEYTSEWYEYVKQTFRSWQTDYGYLFAVKPSAMVIDSHDLDRYYEWADSYGRTEENPEYYKNEYGNRKMRGNFPWKELAKHFDGVHHHGWSSRDSDDFTYGWDVESTAWLNTSVLEYKGAVKLWHGHDEDDE